MAKKKRFGKEETAYVAYDFATKEFAISVDESSKEEFEKETGWKVLYLVGVKPNTPYKDNIIKTLSFIALATLAKLQGEQDDNIRMFAMLEELKTWSRNGKRILLSSLDEAMEALLAS